VPETKGAKRVMAAMKQEYGAKRGERIYYATANKQNRRFSDFHRDANRAWKKVKHG